MKKIKIILIASLIFGGMGAVTAQAENTCPSIAPYQCASGTCVNDPATCSNPGQGGLTTESRERVPSPSPLVTVLASGEKCSGNLHYDRSAMEACVGIAQAQGEALGYNIQCRLDTREEFTVVGANPVGSSEVYYSLCTINGVSGFSAEDLAGYDNHGVTYTVRQGQDTQSLFGPTVRNPMWYTVPCGLVEAAEGRAGTMVGAATCTSGAREYFGSSNPATWSSTNPTTRRPTLGGIPSGTGPAITGGSRLGRPLAAGIYTQALLDMVNRLLDNAKALYGTGATPPPNPIAYGLLPASTTPVGIPSLSYIYTLTTDKTSYCVGEKTLYTIVGPTNLVGAKILWSSTLNKIATKEFDYDYGHRLISQGGGSYWSAYGDPWTAANVGQWEKEANVNYILKTAKFEVKACTAVPPPTATDPKVDVKLYVINETSQDGKALVRASLPGISGNLSEVSTTAGRSNENIYYMWKIQNADYAVVSKQIITDSSLGALPTQSECSSGTTYDMMMFPRQAGGVLQPLVPISLSLESWLFQKGDYFTLQTASSNYFFSANSNICNVGKRFKTTITAYTTYGKSAVGTFEIKVAR